MADSSSSMAEPAPRTGGPAAWLAAALVLAVIITPFVLGVRGQQRGPSLESVERAEALARFPGASLLPAQERQRQWREVVASLTAPDAPLGALVRALIITREGLDGAQPDQARRRIEVLLARLESAPTRLQPDLRRDVLRWTRVVYGETRPLALDEVNELRRAVERTPLGAFRDMARAQLAARAGNAEEAERIRAQAQAREREQGRVLAKAIVSLGLVFLAGILAWVMYLLEVSNRREPPAPLLAPAQTEAAFWAFCVYLGLHYIASLALWLVHRVRPDAQQPLAPWTTLISLPLDALALAVLAWQVRRGAVDRQNLGVRAGRLSGELLWGVGGYAAALPAVVVAVLLVQRIFPRLPSVPHPLAEEFAGPMSTWRVVLLTVHAVVFAPLVEEVFFRGVLLNAIWTRTGSRWTALVVSSAAFAMVHPQIFVGWVGIFVIGLILGGLFTERRSLVPGMIMHGVNNAVALAMVRALGSGASS